MPRSHHHHDVYDDTGCGDHHREFDRRRRSDRHHHPHHSGHHFDHHFDHHANHHSDHNFGHHSGHHPHHSRAVLDPFRDMHNAMRPHHHRHHDEHALGSWGLGPLLGGRGLFSGFDRMFEDAVTAMPNVVESARDGRGSYFYESRTRTVGPDGRVREEHIRTTPDEHGNPTTKRTVRGPESEGEMDPFWNGVRSPFGDVPYGMIRDRSHHDDVVVEELDPSDDEDHRHKHHHHSSRSHDVDAEDIGEELPRRPPRTGDWMREKYNQWRNRA